MDIEYLDEYEGIVLPCVEDSKTNAEINTNEAKSEKDAAITTATTSEQVINFENTAGPSGLTYRRHSCLPTSNLRSKTNGTSESFISKPSLVGTTNVQGTDSSEQPCLVVKCSNYWTASKTKNVYEEKYASLKKMFEPRKQQQNKFIETNKFTQNNLSIDENLLSIARNKTPEPNKNVKGHCSNNFILNENEKINHELAELKIDKEEGNKEGCESSSASKTDNIQMKKNNCDIDNASKFNLLDTSNIRKNADEALWGNSYTSNNASTFNKMGLVATSDLTKDSEAKSKVYKKNYTNNDKVKKSLIINLSKKQGPSRKKSLVNLLEDRKIEENNEKPKNKHLKSNNDNEIKKQPLDPAESTDVLKNVGKINNDRRRKRFLMNLKQSVRQKSDLIQKKCVQATVEKDIKIQVRKKHCGSIPEVIINKFSKRSLNNIQPKQIALKSLEQDRDDGAKNQYKPVYSPQSNVKLKRKTTKVPLKLKAKNNVNKCKSLDCHNPISKQMKKNNCESSLEVKNKDASLNDECGSNSSINDRTDKNLDTKQRTTKRGRPQKNKIKKISRNLSPPTTRAIKKILNKMADLDYIKLYNIKPCEVLLNKLDVENYLEENKTVLKTDTSINMGNSSGTDVSLLNKIISVRLENEKSTSDNLKKRKLCNKSISAAKRVKTQTEEKAGNNIVKIPETTTLASSIVVTKPKLFIVAPPNNENTSLLNDINKCSVNFSPPQFKRIQSTNQTPFIPMQMKKTIMHQQRTPISTANVNNNQSLNSITVPEFIVVESRIVTQNEYQNQISNKQSTGGSTYESTQNNIKTIFKQMFELIDNQRYQNVEIENTEIELKRTAFTNNMHFNHDIESATEFVNIVKNYIEKVQTSPPPIKKKVKKINFRFNNKTNSNKQKIQKNKSLKINLSPSTSQYVKTHNPSSNLIMRIVQNNCDDEPESILPDSFQINSDYIKEEKGDKL